MLVTKSLYLEGQPLIWLLVIGEGCHNKLLLTLVDNFSHFFRSSYFFLGIFVFVLFCLFCLYFSLTTSTRSFHMCGVSVVTVVLEWPLLPVVVREIWLPSQPV